MKLKNLIRIIFAAMYVSVITTGALSQTTLGSSSQSAAGGSAESASFKLVAIAGQSSPVGETRAGQHSLLGGFIYALEAAVIAVTTPAASASFSVGGTMTINWIVTGGAPPLVNIDLSRNNGGTWTPLFTNTANDGTETWPVSAPISNRCFIRVSAAGAASGTSAAFAITPQQFSEISRQQNGGTAQSAYRLLSIPAGLDNAAAQAVLEDDLGAYNIKNWRLYDYEAGSFKEYPNVRPFAAGRAQFLIVRQTSTVDAGPGIFTGDSVKTLSLEAGWNLIGSPYYDRTIPLSGLSLASADRLSLITYNGSWSAPVSAIEPWQGYAINVSAATTLTIRPNYTGTESLPKQEQVNQSSVLWSVQIEARSQQARDDNNFLGWSDSAAEQWDAQDLHEPPAIGEFVAVYFPHEDWDSAADAYTTDFRPPVSPQDGQVWEIGVRSNIDEHVDLNFARVQEVPVELDVYLMDLASGISQDLRARQLFTLPSLAGSAEKRLQLLIGSKEFVQAALVAAGVLPQSFELFQNYPNPFNPETVIRFGLPEASEVTLKIFDLTGREVRTIIDQEKFAAGRYQRLWNGRDLQGQPLSSGVYFYRLQAGGFVKTLKMTLMR